MKHVDCPACGIEGGKVLRLEGSWEWDTNSGPYPVIDERLSCACELSVEQCAELLAGLSMEDFDHVFDE